MNERKLITIERIIKSGVVNFGRNIWLAIASIAMMAITLTILLFAVVANATFTHSVDDITKKIDVKFYLKDGISDKQRQELIGEVKGLPNVEAVQYKSKSEALKEYQQQNVNNPTLLTAISFTDNPLPASLTIKPKDPNKIEDIRNYLDKPKVKALQSENTDYSADRKAAIDKIIRATHFFEEAGFVGIIVFIVISVLIIFNTIRMTIFNRRDELVIMRLLGASTSYIRGPFIVETVLYGIVAAIISLSICGALFKVASSTLKASTFGLLDITYSNSYFSQHLSAILLLQIATGIIIGAASSALATRRYLRVNRQ
jgi:cell division transport system permease protein